MGYDPIGNMLSGTTEASIDPISQQQAYESNKLAAAEEEERKRQQAEAQAQQEQA